MNIILWLIFGGLAGWIASLITGNALGIIGNMVVGVVGAFVGGWIADRVRVGSETPGADRPTSIAAFVWAVIGAIIFLAIINWIFY